MLRCAVYTRVSTEHGLEQEFNSLDNQREASEAYIKSQSHEGWKLVRTHYDDGGYSGGSMDRPALKRLLDDVRARRIDVIVVYKVDRLTRSLADFAKLVELFDEHQVSFVSVADSDEAGHTLNEPAPSEQQEDRCGETSRLRGCDGHIHPSQDRRPRWLRRALFASA